MRRNPQARPEQAGLRRGGLIYFNDGSIFIARNESGGNVSMRSEINTTRIFRPALLAVATLALCAGLALPSIARAQSDDGAAGASSDANQPDQSAPSDDPAAEAAQQAHDAADAAQEALDSATNDRNQLESDGASQDQIDAANEAIAQARAEKEAADEAAQKADEGVSP
jgi:hypothetical protein